VHHAKVLLLNRGGEIVRSVECGFVRRGAAAADQRDDGGKPWNALCSMADRPVGTDLREPAARPMTDTTLGKILTLNSVPAERFVIDGEVGFIERLAKPALVHKHIPQQRVARGPTVGEEGGPTVDDDDLHMPAYMRREHLVENLGRLFRGCIPTERMAVYEKWWYNFSDHYTLVSKLW
jgi:hypothetical protein